MTKQWLEKFLYEMNSEVPEVREIIEGADPSLEVDEEFAQEIREGFILNRKDELVNANSPIEFLVSNTNISETTKPGYIQFHESVNPLDGCFEFALVDECSLRQDLKTKQIYLTDYVVTDDVILISSNPENFMSMLVDYSNLLVRSKFKGEKISTDDIDQLIGLAGGDGYREGVEYILRLD